MDTSIHTTFTECNHDVYQHFVYLPDNDKMASDYDRLLTAAEQIKGWLTPSEVATGLTRGGYEVTPQKLTNWKSRGISKEGLLNAAPILGCRIDWLQTGNGPMRDAAPHQPGLSQIGTPIITWDKPEDLPEGEFVIVPRFDIHVACGNGHVVYEEMPMEQGAAFRSDWVKREGLYLRNLATVRATGDSMEPSIYPGDALLVDRAQTQVQDGRVFLLRFGDEVRVKRLFKRADGGLRIVSDNGGKYPEEVVTAAEMEHIEIIGRVVHKSGAM